MKSITTTILLLTTSTLWLACSSSSGPIEDPMPRGLYTRVEIISGGEIHRSVRVQPDSAFFFDTVYTSVNGVLEVDSVYQLTLELNPSADGYLRAVEEERAGGGAVTGSNLRYWFFFQRNDSLYYYQGMRYRGEGLTLPGTWSMSAADSAYLGRSSSLTFTDDSVTVRLFPTGELTKTTYATEKSGVRTISFGPGNVPPYGPRYEIVPGLALYLTTVADGGYERVVGSE